MNSKWEIFGSPNMRQFGLTLLRVRASRGFADDEVFADFVTYLVTPIKKGPRRQRFPTPRLRLDFMKIGLCCLEVLHSGSDYWLQEAYKQR